MSVWPLLIAFNNNITFSFYFVVRCKPKCSANLKVNLSHPNISMHILHSQPYILQGTDKENLSRGSSLSDHFLHSHYLSPLHPKTDKHLIYPGCITTY